MGGIKMWFGRRGSMGQRGSLEGVSGTEKQLGRSELGGEVAWKGWVGERSSLEGVSGTEKRLGRWDGEAAWKE